MTIRTLPGFRAHNLTEAGRFAALVARGPREWYRIEAKDKSATVHIYDEIGYWGTTAGDFAREVGALDVDAIDLRLNSPGGSVFDGVAIHNTLLNHRARVDVTVDGVAASIASVIAMAGDTVTMGRGTRLMIHNPSGGVIGQAKDMRDMADILDELAKDIAGFYSARAGGSVDQWLASMDAETWYSAQEAVDAGLADSVIGADAPKDSAPRAFDLAAYGFKHAGRDHAPAPAASARSIRSAQLRARHTARRQEARGK
jgi:ATP-dependent Clp endopeptidase proteolytic subunit ClpP